MTNAVTILLKELRKKRIISADLKKEAESTLCETVPFDKPNDLYIRDAIVVLGTILKEDLENHYYIVSVKTGLLNNVLAYALIQRKENKTADIAVYAKEGLIKQNLAAKAMSKVKEVLPQSATPVLNANKKSDGEKGNVSDEQRKTAHDPMNPD